MPTKHSHNDLHLQDRFLFSQPHGHFQLCQSISLQLKKELKTVYILKNSRPALIFQATCIHITIVQQVNNISNRQPPRQVAAGSVGVVQGARKFGGRLMPPPLTDTLGLRTELARLTRCESRNTTTTVMSSWKWRRTPRSIFFRSEYLISLFFAASCNAVFTNLLALPCTL